MVATAPNTVFSIPFRYLWSTNFAGDLDSIAASSNGLARFVGDEPNRLLKIFTDDVVWQQPSLWPLVLFGPSGTGKTSLALNLVSELTDRSTDRSIDRSIDPTHEQRNSLTPVRRSGVPLKPIVLTAADFDRRFRSALATDSIPDFRRKLLRCSGLVIDDLQQLNDKQAAQIELLQIVDQFLARSRPLIVTIDRDPQRCDGLLPQLISRFSSGLSVPVHEPGRLARETIIRDLAEIHRLPLTNSAVELLVERLVVTVPKLVHFFAQLTLLKATGPIDASFVLRMFDRSDEDVLSLSRLIISAVAKEFKVTATSLRSNSRKQSIVLARSVAIFLIRKLLGSSFLKIGVLFGNRDHSTVMHSYRKMESLFMDETQSETPTDLSLKQRIEKLEQRLTNLFASELVLVESQTS